MNTTINDNKSRARKWVNGYAIAGTGVVIAAVIPGSTSAALVAMESHMCYQIGKIYRGDDYTMQEALAAARVIGMVAVAAPLLAMEALNAIPFAGWAVKGGVAGGVIKTLGEAIITYYEKLERRITGEKVSGEILEAEIVASKPPTVQIPMQIQAPVETRLRQIDELFQKGFLTPAERDEKRRQILGEL
jgi:uncharacterized protein (DUF697 family)